MLQLDHTRIYPRRIMIILALLAIVATIAVLTRSLFV